MKTVRIVMGLASMVVLLVTSPSFAQVTSRVTGVVQDKTGGMVADATVTLTNESTNVSFTTTTTSNGTYLFDGIQPGTYRITIEKAGFKKFMSSGNVLTIGQPMTVNAVVELGSVQETIEVQAGAELVQTSTSGNFGNLVNEITLTTLPLVGARGRNPIQLVDFQPGVAVGANTGGGVHVNGARDRAWNYTLDGIDTNETSAGGSDFSPLRPNPDSLAEFRVLTSNFTSEYGRNSGAEVVMVTRSGTNEFHGNGFFFYQTPALNAQEPGDKISGLPKRQFVQKIPGFSLGGPIIKNNTFFFTNLQVLRTLETGQITSTVYTDTARRGVFRYVNGGACGSPCRNRPAGVAGASVDSNGNVLPGVSIGTYDIGASDPQGFGLEKAIQNILKLTPLPNDFTVGDGLNTAGFDFQALQLERQADWVIKLDHAFNSKNLVFVRWAHGYQNTDGDVVNGGWAPFPNVPPVVATHRNPRNLAVSWRWTPTTRITNELVVGMNRFTFDFLNPDPNFQKNPPYVLNDVTIPLQNYVGNKRALTTFQLVDNMTYIRGAHGFRWGINFRYQRHIDDRGSIGNLNAAPSVNFDTSINTVDPVAFGLPSDINTTFDRPTLQRTVNNLLGRVGEIDQGLVAASDSQYALPGSILIFDFRMPEYDFYVQDTWRLRPNLLVDLGVRWEVKLSPRNTRNLILRPDQPFGVGLPPSNTLKWVPGKLYDDDWNNLGPSVGIAWDPFNKGTTSLRANYRLAYDRMNTFSLSSGVFQGLPGLTLQLINQAFGQAGGRIRDGVPVLTAPPGVTPIQLRQPPVFSTNSITVVDPNWHTPKTHMWGLSVQRQLGRSMVAEVSYIGRHGVSLYGGYDANQVEIFNNGFLDAFNTVKTGGESTLMNQLLAGDSRLRSGETPSQMVRRLFASTLSLNSVAALAASIGTRVQGGQQLIVSNGFSPFFFSPYTQFAGGFNVLDSNDFSKYQGLQMQLQRQFVGGLTFQFSYTYAKSTDTRSFDPTFSRVSRGAAQSASSTPYDIRNRRKNYAASDFDRTNVFQSTSVWQLPFGRKGHWGRDWNAFLDRVLGGWEVAGILTLESGRPFTVYSGSNTFTNVVQSPANCSSCTPYMGSVFLDPATGKSFYFTADQQAAFSTPPAGQLGNTGRNFFRLPPYYNLDFAVGKVTRVTERQNIEVRLEMRNATNSVMYDVPNSSIITNSLFARMQAPGALFNSSRKMQISAKYSF